MTIVRICIWFFVLMSSMFAVTHCFNPQPDPPGRIYKETPIEPDPFSQEIQPESPILDPVP